MERSHCRAPVFGVKNVLASLSSLVILSALMPLHSVAQEQNPPSGYGDASGGGSNTSSTELVRQGIRAHSSGDDDTAVKLFSRATELDPNEANALFNLGTIYEARGQLDQALESFRRVAQIDPRDSSAQQEIDRLQAALSRKPGPSKVFQLHGTKEDELAQQRQNRDQPPLSKETPQSQPYPNNPGGSYPTANNPPPPVQNGGKKFHLHGVKVPWSAVALAAVVGGSATAIVAVSKIHGGGKKTTFLPVPILNSGGGTPLGGLGQSLGGGLGGFGGHHGGFHNFGLGGRSPEPFKHLYRPQFGGSTHGIFH